MVYSLLYSIAGVAGAAGCSTTRLGAVAGVAPGHMHHGRRFVVGNDLLQGVESPLGIGAFQGELHGVASAGSETQEPHDRFAIDDLPTLSDLHGRLEPLGDLDKEGRRASMKPLPASNAHRLFKKCRRG